MKIRFFSLVLNGMPWVKHHHSQLTQLKFPWEWHVSEGAAAPVNCTRWCKPIQPALSDDGTHEYLEDLARNDRRVKLTSRKLWDGGKIEMVRAATQETGEGLVWQLDIDELWTAQQISETRKLFLFNPLKTGALFRCRYFVGPDLVITSTETYGNQFDEWKRVWRFKVSDHFISHEPPKVSFQENLFWQPDTEAKGLVFDHMAYATEAQVNFKEKYYGYSGAVEQWKKLQANTVWPTSLKKYLHWVNDDAVVTRIPHAAIPVIR